MDLNFAERSLLRVLWIKDSGKAETVRIYNTRRNFVNLTLYRALERAGKIQILLVENATTENMLYGMSLVTFVLKGN